MHLELKFNLNTLGCRKVKKGTAYCSTYVKLLYNSQGKLVTKLERKTRLMKILFIPIWINKVQLIL